MFCHDRRDREISAHSKEVCLLYVPQHLRALLDELCTGLAGASLAATHNAVRADVNDLPEALEWIGFDMVPAKTTNHLSICQGRQAPNITNPPTSDISRRWPPAELLERSLAR